MSADRENELLLDSLIDFLPERLGSSTQQVSPSESIDVSVDDPMLSNRWLECEVDDWACVSLATLSPEQAERFAKGRCPLYLDGLTDLSPETANALVHHEWLALDSLATISDETAAILASHEGGPLFLRGLKNVSVNAANALRANPRIVLPENLGTDHTATA